MFSYVFHNGYAIKSNRESGTGRPDIALMPSVRTQSYIIIEFKIADAWDKMDETCQKAIAQIRKQRYAEEPYAMGYSRIPLYGIAFWKKQALVRLAADY
ncbi:MAG: PD-(D/E)XK nuclease domain-containing protein [Clostridiales bacterium]|jgi:hypothetical protein|nr:PD-(D/E)XK nuclease domain-containing protein [Clostridiales bacterium]